MAELSFTLLPLPENVQVAREMLRTELGSWGDEETRQVALVLLSEVMTYVVQQTPARVHVTLTVSADRLLGQVRDENPWHPPVDDSAGRGIGVIRALAHEWGIELHPDDGKTVWFEVQNAPRGGRMPT